MTQQIGDHAFYDLIQCADNMARDYDFRIVAEVLDKDRVKVTLYNDEDEESGEGGVIRRLGVLGDHVILVLEYESRDGRPISECFSTPHGLFGLMYT